MNALARGSNGYRSNASPRLFLPSTCSRPESGMGLRGTHFFLNNGKKKKKIDLRGEVFWVVTQRSKHQCFPSISNREKYLRSSDHKRPKAEKAAS